MLSADITRLIMLHQQHILLSWCVWCWWNVGISLLITAWQCGQMYCTGHTVLHIYEQPGSVVRYTVQDMLYCIYMNSPAVWSDVPYRTCSTAYIWTARQCGQMYCTGHAVLHIYEHPSSVVRYTVQDMLYCIYMNSPAVWSDVPYRTCCTAYIWTARQCGQMYCTGHAVLHIYEHPSSLVRYTVQDMLYCIYNSLAVWSDVPYRICCTAYIWTSRQCGQIYRTGHALLHIYEQPGSVVRCTVQDMLYCIYMNIQAVWSDIPYRTCCTAYIWTARQCGPMYRTGHALLHIYEQPSSVVRCTVQDMLYCIYMNIQAVWSDIPYRTCCTAYITAWQCGQMYHTGHAVLHI